MKTRNRPEAIYPLRRIQRGFLMHHLSHPERDQGIIVGRYRIDGPLDVSLLQSAWQEIVSRHPALRASVHWEKISKPVWVVHPKVEAKIEFIDLEDVDESAKQHKLESLQHTDSFPDIELRKAPIDRLRLIRLNQGLHYLVWICHHIMLDGWSTGTIFKELVEVYESHVSDYKCSLPEIISYADYQKTRASSENRSNSIDYWAARVKKLREATLFPYGTGDKRAVKISVSETDRAGFVDFVRKRKTTVTTGLQFVWAVLLAKFFDLNTVAYGMSLNGRPTSIPGMDKLAGMFVNTLPSIVSIGGVNETLKSIHRGTVSANDHQLYSYDDLVESGQGRLPLNIFNSLLVIQSFPWQRLGSGDTKFTTLVGSLTSNYPVSFIVGLHDQWEASIRYDTGSLTVDQAEWFIQEFSRTIKRLGDADVDSEPDFDILAFVNEAPRGGGEEKKTDTIASSEAKSENEKLIISIWEDIISEKIVDIDADFYGLGGNSFLAIRMLDSIEEATGTRISPNEFIANRTARKLARRLKQEAKPENIIPLSEGGNTPPVFCFHAGLGRVTMYRTLAEEIGADRPVYFVQPNQVEAIPETIEEMAAEYIKEIDKIGSTDPIQLISYCVSGTICIEMGRQLVAMGRPAPKVVAVDCMPGADWAKKKYYRLSPQGSLRWVAANLRRGKLEPVVNYFKYKHAPHRAIPPAAARDIKERIVKDKIDKAFKRYEWQNYPHPVLLFLSKSFVHDEERHRDVKRQWNHITDERVLIVETEAKHKDVFSKDYSKAAADRILRYFERNE